MNFVLYLSTHVDFNIYHQYPHKNEDIESGLINEMYNAVIPRIIYLGNNLFFSDLYDSFLAFGSKKGKKGGSKVKVEDRKSKEEKLTKEEFERLAKNCPKKCSNCSFVDCWLLRGWNRGVDEFWHTYPLLGEYLWKEKKVVLYVNNIEDACGKPTYNGVLSTYIHELFHAYFHSVTEQKKVGYNYIREIEEAMTEFSTLVFLRYMKNEHPLECEWNDILKWALESISKKQETIGDLPAYGFGRYLFDNIPENESFDWINKYAERLGYIDEEDELVKQYKQMVCPFYPIEPNKCKELLRKILFERQSELELRKRLVDGLGGDLGDTKLNMEEKLIQVSGLLPTQNEIDITKSLDYVLKWPAPNLEKCFSEEVELGGFPLVTVKSNFIIDGHHKWLQVRAVNPSAKMKCYDYSASGLSPVDILKAAQESIGAVMADSDNKNTGDDEGKLPKAHAGNGTNIYSDQDFDKEGNDFAIYIKAKATPEFYKLLKKYVNKTKEFKTKLKTDEDCIKYVVTNLIRMRANNPIYKP